MDWEPISQDDFLKLVESERSTLGAEELAVLDKYGVRPEHIFRIFPFGSGKPDAVFVVARDGPRVLFYDDTEEEFGTATLDEDGMMHDWSTSGERLAWALRQFPRQSL